MSALFKFQKGRQDQLSVNGYGGAVWYHTWHGAFVASKEVGG